MGCWTPVEYFDPQLEAGWHVANAAADGSRFDVICEGESAGHVQWGLIGRHNIANALAALAAARHAGVPPRIASEALARFKNVKRRLELRGEVKGIRVYDDFAHHPTAIELTLEGLRRQVGGARIIAVLEPRSHTMKRGVHADRLAGALSQADHVLLYASGDLQWDAREALLPLGRDAEILADTRSIVEWVANMARPGDHVLVMSNGGFEGIHQRLLDALVSNITLEAPS